MDPLILREKLESLRRCIARVETKRPASVAELESDIDLQDSVSTATCFDSDPAFSPQSC